MLRKEMWDTLKMSAGMLLLALSTLLFSYWTLRYGFEFEFGFGFFVLAFSWLALVLIAFQLGSTIFAREKGGNVFEYFFSLPVPRRKLLMYKIMPRFLALVGFFVLYYWVGFVLYDSNEKIGNDTFALVLMLIFLFSVSMSMMYRRSGPTVLLNLFWFVLVFFVTRIITEVFQEVFVGEPVEDFLTYFVIVFGMIAVAMFVGFVVRFAGVDMSNMAWVSRRNALMVLLPLMLFMVFFVGINRFDTGNPGGFTADDLLPASFDRSNGFYRFWTLAEPMGVDVESDAVYEKYRRWLDPGYGGAEGGKGKSGMKRFNMAVYRADTDEAINSRTIFINLERATGIAPGIWDYLSDPKINLAGKEAQYRYMLDRYQKLIQSPVVRDFSLPDGDGPIFNHLVWLRIFKLYVAVKAHRAVGGEWENGVADLLAHVAFCRRVIGGSRLLITNLVGKAGAGLTLQMLAAIMNHPDCPSGVYRQVLEGLPPLGAEDFSSRNSFVFESLTFRTYLMRMRDDRGWAFRIGEQLFLQPNRTVGYLQSRMKEVLRYAETPPYQWESGPPDKDPASGIFWWLVNPMGKMAFRNSMASSTMIFLKTHRARAFYDMLRISAELHLKDDPARPVVDVLRGLKSYDVLDQCSGLPYAWNPSKRVLYGIGTDRKDDGGMHNLRSIHTDFALPVRLKGRG